MVKIDWLVACSTTYIPKPCTILVLVYIQGVPEKAL